MTASLDTSHPPTAPSTGRPGAGRPLDWPTLAEQLLEEFPDATITEVVRELRQARDGVEHLTIRADEAIVYAAVIARHQLSILTGRPTEGAPPAAR